MGQQHKGLTPSFNYYDSKIFKNELNIVVEGSDPLVLSLTILTVRIQYDKEDYV